MMDCGELVIQLTKQFKLNLFAASSSSSNLLSSTSISLTSTTGSTRMTVENYGLHFYPSDNGQSIWLEETDKLYKYGLNQKQVRKKGRIYPNHFYR